MIKEKAKKTNKVKCRECGNMNKYGWCMMKKRCFNEIERNIERSCKSFFIRRYRKKKIKY